MQIDRSATEALTREFTERLWLANGGDPAKMDQMKHYVAVIAIPDEAGVSVPDGFAEQTVNYIGGFLGDVVRHLSRVDRAGAVQGFVLARTVCNHELSTEEAHERGLKHITAMATATGGCREAATRYAALLLDAAVRVSGAHDVSFDEVAAVVDSLHVAVGIEKARAH